MRRGDRIGGKICSAAAALVIAAGAAWGCWRDAQPKFQNVTISAGDSLPDIARFVTEYGNPDRASFVTDPAQIDTGAVGDHPIILKHDNREETVTVSILDTLPPELVLTDLELTADTQLDPEDFVSDLFDHSAVSLAFEEAPEIPRNYSDLSLTITATDAYGNETSGTCTASFVWLLESVTLEYGQTLTKADLLYNPERDSALIRNQELARLNSSPVGEYDISSTSGGKTLTCHVTIEDTTGPVLELKEHQVYVGRSAQLSDFIVSATDVSGDVTLRLVTELDWTTVSTQTIVIEAEDIYGNVTTGETIFYVVTDLTPPAISGVSAMTVEKYSSPDYLEGVTAVDAVDGEVEVTCDASMVDTSVAGDYFITYTAKDSSGNEASVRRKVTVNHDEEDTLALAESIAATLEDDPELIRDYVRRTIYYSSDWGGDDPVWSGFTNMHGNCYVHALCLKSLLDVKGYNTQLIWVTNKTHYWLIIEIEDGVWRHIDATPGDTHSRYSLMTDDLRMYTLSGRDWDHSAWPACE